MTFRVTGYFRRPDGGGVMDVPPRRLRVRTRPVAQLTGIPEEVVVSRGAACLGCDWLDQKCQHPGCSVCPGRQLGQPWMVLNRCPAGRW